VTVSDLDVVFQPIVDLSNGSTFAHEALTRCKWPEFKNPMKLFEQAQEERCCGSLGRKVREVAFARCTDAPLFVNLHPHELDEGWLVRPDDPLFFHERAVYLEITESAAFNYFSLCMNVLKEICSRSGAFLVVDDFGAGHSNLKRIIDLEPHVVKLDLALVRGIEKKQAPADLGAPSRFFVQRAGRARGRRRHRDRRRAFGGYRHWRALGAGLSVRAPCIPDPEAELADASSHSRGRLKSAPPLTTTALGPCARCQDVCSCQPYPRAPFFLMT